MVETTDVLVNLVQKALVPVLLASGVGLYTLIVQTRYGRVVDRMRVINAERLSMIKALLTDNLSEKEKEWNNERLEDIKRQLDVFVKRGSYLKNALVLMFVTFFAFVTSSLVLYVEQLLSLSLSAIILILFSVGIGSVFFSVVFVLLEVNKSYSAVLYDIGSDVPKRLKLPVEESSKK